MFALANLQFNVARLRRGNKLRHTALQVPHFDMFITRKLITLSNDDGCIVGARS